MFSVLTIKTNSFSPLSEKPHLFSSICWGGPSRWKQRWPYTSTAQGAGHLTRTFISAGSKLCSHHHIPSCVTTIEPNIPSVVASLQTSGFKDNIWIKQPLKALCYRQASWHQYNATHFFLHCSFFSVFRVKLFLATFFLPDTLGRTSFVYLFLNTSFKSLWLVLEFSKTHSYLNHFFQAPFQSRYFEGAEP